MRLADHIRTHAVTLIDAWAAAACAELPELRTLERARLVDVLPDALREIAGCLDGADAASTEACLRLARAHADERAEAGVSLPTLVREYLLLRETMLASVADEAAELRRLHELFDHALAATVERYVERREQARDRFLAILGHDLRGPLHVVELVLRQLPGTDGDDRHRVTERGLRATARMERLVRDLLDFARAALGAGIPVRVAPTDLGDVGRAVVDEVTAANPGRTVLLEAAGALDGWWDGERLAQALGNLVANALQHGREPVVLRLRGDADAVTSEVADGGELQTLDGGWPRGERLRGHADGLGLGLYIVQEIARAHGTSCELHRDDGQTVFRIRWPRRPAASAAASGAPSAAAPSVVGASAGPAARPAAPADE